MLKIVTVCGNGIGSSLMLKMKIEAIAKENNIAVSVVPSDSNAATGKDCDLFVTVKEFASIFKDTQRVAITRSYMNTKKITEDVLPVLIELNQAKGE